MVSENSLEVPQSLDMKIPCSEILKSHLNWWRDPNNVLIGTPLHAEEHTLLLFTDASVKGWGAHLEDQTVSGLWSDTEKNLHINVLELKAVFLAIRSFQSHLLNKRVLGASDNVTVVSYLNKQGGDPSLRNVSNDMASDGLLQSQSNFAKGSPHTALSECDSRQPFMQGQNYTNRMVSSSKDFSEDLQIWHRPMVDMFATKMNNKLPLYVSPVPDPNAMAVDALNISWQALDGYAYCPIALIPKMIQKMKTYACQMIVIAPGWPGMSWFWDLLELSTKPPLLLPHWETLLKLILILIALL